MGVIVVALIVVALWWAMSLFGVPGSQTNQPQATTTPQAKPVASETRTGSSVAAVASSLPGATRFASLLSSTGVGASLTGAGPYTVFVADDEAFSYLAAGTLENMTAAQKKRLVQYHIVAGKMLDVDAVSSGNHIALSKDSLNFDVRTQDKSAFVNSAYVLRQYKASNGIVYLISGAVLLPPQTGDAGTGATGTITP